MARHASDDVADNATGTFEKTGLSVSVSAFARQRQVPGQPALFDSSLVAACSFCSAVCSIFICCSN